MESGENIFDKIMKAVYDYGYNKVKEILIEYIKENNIIIYGINANNIAFELIETDAFEDEIKYFIDNGNKVEFKELIEIITATIKYYRPRG